MVFRLLYIQHGNTALIIACGNGYHDDVTALLNMGAEPNKKNKFGSSALILSTQKQKMNCIEALLNHPKARVDINITDEELITALMWASWHNNIQIVEFLIRRGADVNKVSKNGRTAIYWAVEKGHVSIVSLLLEHGGDPNIVLTSSCSSPLLVASRMNNVDMIRVLIEGTLLLLHRMINIFIFIILFLSLFIRWCQLGRKE